MKEQLINYQELDKRLKNDIKNSVEDKDYIKIELHLYDNQKIYNEFSSVHKAKINNELITFLEDEIKYKSPEKNVIIEIETKENDENFLRSFNELIKKNIIEDIKDLDYSLKRNSKIAWSLCSIGLIILGAISLFTYLSEYYVFNEFFVIVSWVLIWQFVEMYFFDRPELKYKKMKFMQLYFAEYRYKQKVSFE